MSLTSTDETDLLLPLLGSIDEAAPFATFLERVRRRVEADYVAIVIRRHVDPERAATEFFAGTDLRKRAREIGIAELYMLEGVQTYRLRPDRVYAVSEFIDHDPAYRARRQEGIEQLGIADERVIRLFDGGGITSWMVIAKNRPCSASDSALLSSLAPYVVIALRNLLILEQQRIESAMGGEGLGRLGLGWLLFDELGGVLLADPMLERMLADTCGIVVRIGERLALGDVRIERELQDAAGALAQAETSPPRTIVLRDEPRLEALLFPAGNLVRAIISSPRVLALLRYARSPGEDRATSLAALFALPPREAELAVLLTDGSSIAGAAETMGLTIETARNYSKRLYAKLGVSGQAQLVRRVLDSSAMLA